MSVDIEPLALEPQDDIKPLSHQRILVIMTVLGLAGSIFGIVFVSIVFGLGVLIGGLLAFINYYWLKVSLKQIFDVAAETGKKPRLLAVRYFARYIVLGSVVAVLYATQAVEIVGVILGMPVFGFAVVIDGFIRIFSSIWSEPPA